MSASCWPAGSIKAIRVTRSELLDTTAALSKRTIVLTVVNHLLVLSSCVVYAACAWAPQRALYLLWSHPHAK